MNAFCCSSTIAEKGQHRVVQFNQLGLPKIFFLQILNDFIEKEMDRQLCIPLVELFQRCVLFRHSALNLAPLETVQRNVLANALVLRLQRGQPILQT